MSASVFALGCAGSKSPLDDEPPAAYVRIDDMEGSGQIQWLPESAAEGSAPGTWDTQAGSQCGNIQPLPSYLGGTWSYAKLEEPYPTFPGVLSRQAARLYTTAPLVNTWGATLGFDFSSDDKQPTTPEDAGDPATCTAPLKPAGPVDLRAYRGIAFYARAVPEAGITAVFVKLHDRNTDPRGKVCERTLGSDRECYNAFGHRVVLDAEFRRYTIFFADFTQEFRWGYRPPEGLPDLESVYSLVFQVRTPGGPCDPPRVCLGGLPELTFDVWIDDLAFIER